MDNEFIKPYLAEILGRSAEKRYYVYDRDVLKKEDIFPYFVLDGGAFFLTNDIFGGADSNTLLKKTLSGEVLDIVREADGTVNWTKSYDTCLKNGLSRQHEWQSWPQRLYMLLPLAQEYLRTENELYSSKWLEIFSLWVDNSPYEKFEGDVPSVLTTMKWRDMQVGWRTLTVIYSIFMLGGAKKIPFTKEQWKYIYDFLDLNLSHLVLECEYDEAHNRFGNHVLQKAVGLVVGATLFPELARSEQYLAVGKKVVLFCHKNAILDDGASNEASPSYSHFIARLYVEAEITLERNGYPELDGIHNSIIRQYQWLAKTSTRQGKTLQLNDSYVLDAHKDIENVAAIMSFTPDFTKQTEILKDSGLAILRNDRCEAILDGMKQYGGHQCEARLNALLFVDGLPLLVDSGCFSYDWFETYSWSHNDFAHSVVYAEELYGKARKYDVSELEYDEKHNAVTSSVTVTSDNISYTWKRTLALCENGAEIVDKIESSEPLSFVGNFYLAGNSTCPKSNEGWRSSLSEPQTEYVQKYGNTAAAIACTEPLAISKDLAMNGENKLDKTVLLKWKKHTAGIEIKTSFKVK